MVSVIPKHIAAFVLGPDHRIHRKYKDDGNPDTAWSGWGIDGGGPWIDHPVAIRRAPGEVDIFMIGPGSGLNQSNFNFLVGHGLGPWKHLGGTLLFPPAVANRKGTIHIFHIGADHALYHKAWDGARYTPGDGYERLGGVFIHSPAAVSAGEDEVSVFAIGLTDGCLHHYHWKTSTGWDPVTKLPGLWVGAPSAVSDQKGCWDIFGVDPNGKINHVSHRDGKQSDLETITGLFKTIDAISWGPGRIDLIGLGLDSAVHHKAWAHGTWGQWEDLKGSIVHRPTPVSHSPGALCVLAVWANSQMFIRIRNPTTGVWGAWTDIGVGVAAISQIA